MIIITPNIIAYLALAGWPLLVWQLYRRLDKAKALIWTVLGSYLLLPPATVFDLPMVPDMDKDSLPILAAAVTTILMLREKIALLPQGLVARGLVLTFMIAPFFTVLSNGDPIFIRLNDDVPGMSLYDSIATIAAQGLMILPMIMARRDLAQPDAIMHLLSVLLLAALLYSVPMLFETRFSPQLNKWIYGYHQHDFSQAMRFGGFRPLVFLPHGLWLAIFTLMALFVSALFLRLGPAEARPKYVLIFVWLAFMLYLCKSFGPGAYAMLGLVLIFFAPVRWQIYVAGALAALVIAYPLLRGLHLVPLDDILTFARSLSAERAWSLEYRIINEEQLLDRAALRPWFGWGGYARNLEHDLVTGRILTIPDGGWIIRIGSYGWLGYLSQFGLLCLPLWALCREAFAPDALITRPLALVALIYTFNLLDLLPNATLVPLTWLLAGMMLGQAERLARERRLRIFAVENVYHKSLPATVL